MVDDSKMYIRKDKGAKLSSKSLLIEDILRHIRFSLGNDPYKPDFYSCYVGLALSVRDRLVDRWIETQNSLYETLSKRVYFLSLEFLPGRFLRNYLISLNMEDEARETLKTLGFDIDELQEEEWDAGLGNGGLGRLASCFMDSIACLNYPGYGYGIRYDYGIFHQVIENGYQKEQCDNWSRFGNPWEFHRYDLLFPVHFYGRSESYTDSKGTLRYRLRDTDVVLAMACDILIPGCEDQYVTNMRLWKALSSREFNLETFNQGDYIGAVQGKVLSENISKVLYPNDEMQSGRELRLKQQYFFVAATLADILRRFKKMNSPFSNLPEYVAIQLNDTHPSIAIAELMRILVDEEDLKWDEAWSICQKIFAYTNHTVLPEALETWPVDLVRKLLPRHMEIIFEINRLFIESLPESILKDANRLSRISLIQEGSEKRIRMAHLCIVGSHSVNGVAELHSRILKNELFRDFDQIYPGRMRNVTNGISQRRWLYQCNPLLSKLITEVIGPDWILNLSKLEGLASFAENEDFQRKWMDVKLENKKNLARYILRKKKLGVDPHTLFDIHVKRIHEYKRQLLNILHVISLYFRIKNHPEIKVVPRTFIFAGKAAPSYHRAKLIIKLINSVSEKVNMDEKVKGRLRILFLPNYCVSQAEKVIPGVDLSEQISTAGMEASGTGNMKMSLNGALTIGTLDGANIEISEEVGRENIFIFGLTADEVLKKRRDGYDPLYYYNKDEELKSVLDAVGSGFFSPEDKGLFKPLTDSLLYHGDYYMLLADYRSYLETQETVSRTYLDTHRWAKMSILNVANMGKFSSDRAVKEYAETIWKVKPVDV